MVAPMIFGAFEAAALDCAGALRLAHEGKHCTTFIWRNASDE